MVLDSVKSSQLTDRRSLLSSFDAMRRDLDSRGSIDAMDSIGLQALEILTSSKLMDALDLSKEPSSVREKFGKGDSKNYGDGAPRNIEHFLMARRLIEAGARVVTLNFGRWDFHSNNFSECKNTHFPMFDHAMHCLITDLHQRGLDKDVAVVAWGEFGRTPRINKDAGRDHWPQVGGALLAGADSAVVRLLVQPIGMGAALQPGPFISARFMPAFISTLASTPIPQHSMIMQAGRIIWWMNGRHFPNLFNLVELGIKQVIRGRSLFRPEYFFQSLGFE